jgi:YD repeat-containing protein
VKVTDDGLGRTVSVSLPNSSGSSTYLYEGNAVTVTSPASKWRKYESDAFGNVSKTIEPNPAGGANLETTFSYNLVGQRTQVQMTRGSVTQTRTWNYSPTTLLLMSETQPESGTTSYYYDYFGRLQSVTKANGGSVSYGRDAFGRLSTITDTANVCSNSSYTYGSSLGTYGRLHTVTWGTGCATKFDEIYDYSISGLVAKKEVKITPGGTVALGYTYNNEGQVTGQSRAVTGGGAPVWTNYGYDSMGRPSTMTGLSTVISVTYNAADQLLTMIHGGVQETRQYNERMQLTRITVPGQMDLEYRYSATQNDGNITSMKNNINGEEVNYSYDALNRLSSAVDHRDRVGFVVQLRWIRQ